MTARVERGPRAQFVAETAGTSTGLSLSVSADGVKQLLRADRHPNRGAPAGGDGLRVGGPPTLPHKAMYFLR